MNSGTVYVTLTFNETYLPAFLNLICDIFGIYKIPYKLSDTAVVTLGNLKTHTFLAD